jgi:hypothetical protein
MTTVTEDSRRHEARERATVPEQLVRLASRYAAEGDVRRAQLASWTADVYVLEELLWEHGLAEVPDPVARLASIGESVADALEALAEGVTGEVMPRAVVEEARRAMILTFDESVHEVLREQLPPLEHLAACEPDSMAVSERANETPVRQRLGDLSADELVSELRQVATDCLHVGEVMDVEGELTAADRMSHQADVATFEAYLLAAAVHAGDHQMASVDLRWELARELQPAESANDGRGQSPFATLRRELIALVGSAEMESLWRAFEAADGGA